MYLKRIELTGFKSFADRTLLDLSKGLNAVVGPNGSGKSNVADALRWVLGEQSAKQLRGGKMEDIIFSGTAHRRPLGYAEIVIRIDNSDHKLPLEFKEISVTRRVYRSGESEYAINGEACRLKDIQMLFMDTGIGRDGYSIIGQGRIDEILSLRSEDRRVVFEEAAGIGKFKTRRNEALSKLEKERQNRERVDDIIVDLEEQLTPLETQAEEAKRYLSLRDRYKTAHVNIFLQETGKIETELGQLEKSLTISATQFQDSQQLLTEARMAGIGLKESSAKLDQQYQNANEALLTITTETEKKEGEAKLLESQIEQMAAEVARLKDESAKRDESIAAKAAERQAETENRTKAESELNLLNQELAEHQKLSDQWESILKESAATIDTHNRTIMDALTAVANSRGSVTEAENTYTRLENEKDKLDTEIENHESKIEEQKQAAAEAKTALQLCKNEYSRAKTAVEAYAHAYNQLIEESREIDNEFRKTQEELTTVRGKHRAIESLEAQHEGFYQSVKTVLRKKATDPAFAGICGAVSELIGVGREYEVAIETALGGAAQNIVTRTEDDAKRAVNMLKETRSGRATFLPLTSVKGRQFNTSGITKEAGFIGTAADLVTCDSEYAQVISQLLGDVIIMDTMDNAMAFNKRHKYSHKIVTLGGERFSPGGAITGGASRQTTTGIIGRSRHLEDLRRQMDTLQQTADELDAQINAGHAKRQTTEETLNTAREKEQSMLLETERLSDKLAQAEELLQNLNMRGTQYTEENDKLMTMLVETNQAIRAAKRDLQTQEENVQKAHIALENHHRYMDQTRIEHTEETGNLTDLKIEISRRREWAAEATRNVERLQRDETVLEEEKRVILSQIAKNERGIESTRQKREKTLEDLTSLKAHIEKTRQSLKHAQSERTNIESALAKAEADERVYADSSAKVERELARLEMRKEQLDATSHRLHNEIWDEYNLTPVQAQAFKRDDISETALRREMQELRAELSTLTNVNVGAIDAYKQMKTRYDFLTAQRDDILQAEASLDELIATLTKQMEEQFSVQFALIAQHFEEVFQQMFSGGKAALRLVDMDNVLESGIEITAQPPGKALQNLMLLSGGERALTAIALLFSILRLKPSPFCVLDEIESALDDANVTRFAKYLKEYAAGTQFIIITHRKGTMEAADHMYGVTMEEQGISKLVSVRFE